VAALLAMGTGTAVPAAALGATGGATLARVQRLLSPPGGGARGAAALLAVTLLLAAASAVIPALAA
jgi:hypothetical protein